MSRSLRPWLQQRIQDGLNQDAASDLASDHTFAPGSRVQIMRVRKSLTQFLTFRPEHAPDSAVDIWAQVCDQTHYIAARFTSSCVDAFQTSSPYLRLTQMRGAIIAVERCRLTRAKVHVQCDGSPWSNISPPTTVLDVDGFALLGGIGEPVHSGHIRDVTYGYDPCTK